MKSRRISHDKNQENERNFPNLFRYSVSKSFALWMSFMIYTERNGDPEWTGFCVSMYFYVSRYMCASRSTPTQCVITTKLNEVQRRNTRTVARVHSLCVLKKCAEGEFQPLAIFAIRHIFALFTRVVSYIRKLSPISRKSCVDRLK